MEHFVTADTAHMIAGKHSTDFFDCVSDLIDTPRVKELAACEHHVDGTRLEHVVGVAFRAFVVAKAMGLDSRAVARAGLLHDLFFYDYYAVDYGPLHIYIHPLEALENAKKITELSEVEEEIIRCHMWPLCDTKPKFSETYLVSVVDKYCAVREAVASGWWRMWYVWRKTCRSLRKYGYVISE